MGSSKKKGQQRKAAKKALSAAAEGDNSGGVNSGSIDSTASNGGGNSKFVAKVRRGNNYATKRLTSGVALVSSGVLSAVLGFLKRCEDETFEQVLSSVGGDLKSPSSWIDILVRATLVDPNCKLQIAENIGPLVRCMSNDMERLLFKNNKHWRQGIQVFAHLILNVIELREKQIESMQIVEALLQHNGVLESIIQWGFWIEGRPDIVNELKSEGITFTGSLNLIRRTSWEIMGLLVLNDNMEGESRIQLLKKIGTTPIINKEYDPSCTVSYTAGLARQLKSCINVQESDVLGEILQRLIRDADCVGKDVITEIIDLGTNYTSQTGGLHMYVAKTSLAMLVKRQQNDLPCDTFVAFAIRSRLIEMCLGFIERSRSTGIKEYMYNSLKFIFSTVHALSLHQKTAKAIRSKKADIEDKLVRLEQNSGNTSNAQSKELLDMARSILDISGSYCCRCNKPLSRTEVKQCNGCGRMTYCSRACQREDWLNGHKLACCHSPTIEHAGQFQGRYWPEVVPSDERAAAKLKEIEINMNMIQLKLFLDHSETIVAQAKGLDIPLHDCVVKFDLRLHICPHTVEIEKYTNALVSQDNIEGYEESRSKDNIMCVYHSIIYIGKEEEVLAMQRHFPHEWLKKRSK